MSSARTASLFLVGVLLTAASSIALAGGINLSWNDCGSFGVGQKSFACSNNSGVDALVASAVPNAAMPALNGNDCTILIQTPSATLPAWWQLQTGGCRAGNLSANADFTTFSNCIDPWQGQAAAGSIYDSPAPGFGPDFARVRTTTAIPTGTEIAVDAAHELYLVRLTLQHVKSAGAGSCAGCTQSACIVLQTVHLYAPTGVLAQTLTNPVLRQHVVWQDPALVAGCPGATPARDHTWGSVKSLYR